MVLTKDLIKDRFGSIKEFANRVDVTPATVYSWCRGSKIKTIYLLDIADTLDLTEHELCHLANVPFVRQTGEGCNNDGITTINWIKNRKRNNEFPLSVFPVPPKNEFYLAYTKMLANWIEDTIFMLDHNKFMISTSGFINDLYRSNIGIFLLPKRSFIAREEGSNLAAIGIDSRIKDGQEVSIQIWESFLHLLLGQDSVRYFEKQRTVDSIFEHLDINLTLYEAERLLPLSSEDIMDSFIVEGFSFFLKRNIIQRSLMSGYENICKMAVNNTATHRRIGELLDVDSGEADEWKKQVQAKWGEK